MPDGFFDLSDCGRGGSVAIDGPVADAEPDADEGKMSPKLEAELERSCLRVSVPVEAYNGA